MIEPDFTFKNLVYIVKKRFKFFVIVSILATLAGIVFSSWRFMTPRYESHAVVFPKNLEPYSEESETEQMLQLLQFSEIKDTLVFNFDMYKRWGLKPDEPEYRYWLNLLYEERVRIAPTKYESIKIECQDETPEVAKQMVEEIIEQYNRLTGDLEKNTYSEYLTMKENEVAFLGNLLDSLDKDLKQIRENTGVVSLSGQLERMTEGYMRMLEKGVKGQTFNEISEKLENLEQEGGELLNGVILSENIGAVYQEVVEDLNEAKSYSSRNISYCDVIVRPEVADKKSWPVRWLVCLGVLSGSLILTLLIFAFIDKRPGH